MRSLGPVLVVLAVAAVQVPWFTCHSKCQNECGILWVFEDHHCHDTGAADHHTCTGHQHVHGASHHGDPQGDLPSESGDDHQPGDHQPGDHAVYFHPVVEGQPSLEVAAPSLAAPAVPPPAFDLRLLVAEHAAAIDLTVTTGPPADLATVRLLL